MKRIDNENFNRRISVFQDIDYPMNPIEDWDMAFQFHLKWDREFNIVSKDSECPVVEWGKTGNENGAKMKPGLFALPVYAYVHSGIVFSLSPFSCPWDSGLAGFIYLEKKQFCKDFNLKRFNPIKALKIAKKEIEVLNQWVSGDIWGYKIEIRKDENSVWEVEDSCGGFFGKDGIEDALKEIDAYDGKSSVIADDTGAEYLFD